MSVIVTLHTLRDKKKISLHFSYTVSYMLGYNYSEISRSMNINLLLFQLLLRVAPEMNIFTLFCALTGVIV